MTKLAERELGSLKEEKIMERDKNKIALLRLSNYITFLKQKCIRRFMINIHDNLRTQLKRSNEVRK